MTGRGWQGRLCCVAVCPDDRRRRPYGVGQGSFSRPEAGRQPEAAATVRASAPRAGHRAFPSLLPRVVKAAAAGDRQAYDLPSPEPFLRSAAPGRRVRSLDHSGAARSSRRHDPHGLHPGSEPGPGGRPVPSRPAREPAPLGATSAGRHPVGRNRLQAPAAYPGAVHRASRTAGACAGKGIPKEPMAGRSEIGCSFLQP